MGVGKSHFIPMPRHEVKERLFAEPAFAPLIQEGLKSVCSMLEALDHHSSLGQLERLKVLYSSMDPDSERPLDLAEVDAFIAAFEEVLVDGNWEHITDEEFDLALEGESLFPISMDVRIDEFVTMKLYKLGHDEMTENMPNTLDKLLRRPGKEVKFDMYNRVIQIIRFQESEWFVEQGKKKHDPGKMGVGLHLRLFKNVPVADLEVIFPNTSPKMRPVDRAKISFPLLVGLVMLFQQYLLPIMVGGPTVDLSQALLIALAGALGSYAMKAYMTYRKTKENYMAAVAKDLYFKGQANNQAVLNMVIDLAEEQEGKESLLCYTFLLAEADEGHSIASLDGRIEAWLADQGVFADFEIRDAIGDLTEIGLVELSDGVRNDDGSWNIDAPLGRAAVPIKESLARLDDIWDGLYNFEH
jgi:hypothetical protein